MMGVLEPILGSLGPKIGALRPRLGALGPSFGILYHLVLWGTAVKVGALEL